MPTDKMFRIIILVALVSGCKSSVSTGDLTNFMTDIWDHDVNAATSTKVNIQGHTSTGSTSDHASSSLFTYVNDQFYLSRPTYSAFVSLLDNYNSHVGSTEHSNPTEETEISRFLTEISKTSVMQKTLNFLHQNGYVEPTWSSLETKLRQLWFDGYPRHGTHSADSSGFEHVFVGEVDNSEVVGFHNWLQFHLQEQKGAVNYKGFIYTKQPNTVGLTFSWYHNTKPITSLLYGTSPEFELAMYTVCYLTRPNQHCNFSVHGHNMQIQTYKIHKNGEDFVGSAYVN